MTVGKNRNPVNSGNLSNREKILRRYFNMYVNAGKYNRNQFHDFCSWAKGKSESALVTELGK